MAATPVSADEAVRAGTWSALDIVFRQGVQFVVTVVLARLLSPEDFGLIALLAVFTGLATVILEGGLSTALIRASATTRIEESSVFWFNLGAGLVCAALMLSAAPWVAQFYGFPLLVPLIAVAAAQVAVASLGSVPSAMMIRSLRFRTLLAVGGTASIVSGSIGIALAATGFGVWALSLQAFAAAVTTTSMLWLLSGWRPSLAFSPSQTGHLFRFGSHYALSGFLDILYTQGFALLVGKLHGVRDLGLYNRAQSTQSLPTGILSQIIGRVTLPVLATRADDPDGMRRAVRRSIRLAMAISMPAMIGLSVLSDLVVVVLFGNKWAPSAPILAVLAIVGSFFPVHIINLQALLGLDKSKVYLWSTISKQLIGVACVIVGSFFGIMGLAYSQAVYVAVGYFINTETSRRYFAYGPFDQLRDLSGIIAVSIAMGGLVLLARSLVELPLLVELPAMVAFGAAAYFGLGALFRVNAILETFSLALSLRSAILAKLPGRRAIG